MSVAVPNVYFIMPGNSFLRFLAVVVLVLAVPITGQASEQLRGAPAPDFALKSMTGENLRLSEYRGEVVLLNFWSSRCGMCLRQMPEVSAIYEDYRDSGLQVLAISLDHDIGKTQQTIADLHVSYPVLFDADKSVSRQYKLGSMPVVVVIDRTGVVRYVHARYRSVDRHEYRTEIEELLAE